MTIVKLCGFKNKEDVNLAVKLGADYIGFVFHALSPRNITPALAKEIAADIPSRVKKVAVIVDANDEKISEIVKNLKPDYLQLHGRETTKRITEIKRTFAVQVIKAIPINSASDLLLVKEFEPFSDMFLFDSKINSYSGGTGISFNWKILQNLKTPRKWFLAGGLNINNIAQAIEISKANMIDVSSGIEEVRGVKSQKLMKEFMAKLNKSHL